MWAALITIGKLLKDNWKLALAVAAAAVVFAFYKYQLHQAYNRGVAATVEEYREQAAENLRLEKRAALKQQTAADKLALDLAKKTVLFEAKLKDAERKTYALKSDLADCRVVGQLRDDYNAILSGQGDGPSLGGATAGQAPGGPTGVQETSVSVKDELIPTCNQNAVIGAHIREIAEGWKTWWKGQVENARKD